MGWTWLHLLQFCVSNQSANPEEDALNKPWRPIPSRRISVSATHVLRWVLLPICFALSILLRVPLHGVAFAVAIFVHNDLRLDRHWLLRTVCNAWGYA
ncbi:hypothetical protein BV25DRAFT_1817197, partial [Artomyces pyxidatus]